MNEVCTALADALRKAGEKDVGGLYVEVKEYWTTLYFMFGASNISVDLGRLNDPNHFTLDHMDAVAAALGMRFDVRFDWPVKDWSFETFLVNGDGDWEYLEELGRGGYPDKRTASLAALLAIITHALQEDGK